MKEQWDVWVVWKQWLLFILSNSLITFLYFKWIMCERRTLQEGNNEPVLPQLFPHRPSLFQQPAAYLYEICIFFSFLFQFPPSMHRGEKMFQCLLLSVSVGSYDGLSGQCIRSRRSGGFCNKKWWWKHLWGTFFASISCIFNTCMVKFTVWKLFLYILYILCGYLVGFMSWFFFFLISCCCGVC